MTDGQQAHFPGMWCLRTRARRTCVAVLGLGCVLFVLYGRQYSPQVSPMMTGPSDGNIAYTKSSQSLKTADSLMARFAQRQSHLMKKCQDLSPRTPVKCSIGDIKNSIFFTEKRDIGLCAIEKAGSTFWKRILFSAGPKGKDIAFTVDADKVRSRKGDALKMIETSNVTLMEDKINRAHSFLIVRDPYMRALSGWYDKLYSPNPFYWGYVGKRAKASQQRNGTMNERLCGSGVTFVEFIRFLTKVLSPPGACYDGHFSPMHDHCFPCTFKYDFIGKYETIKEDTEFLMKQFKLTGNVKLPNLKTKAIYAEFLDKINYAFSMKQSISKCIKFKCALFHLWRKFQASGVIETSFQFPIQSESEANNMTAEKFASLLMEAHNKSSREKLRQNKLEALSQAFVSLDAELLTKFTTVFHNDFELFDYSKDVPILNYSVKFDYMEQCPF